MLISFMAIALKLLLKCGVVSYPLAAKMLEREYQAITPSNRNRIRCIFPVVDS